MLAFSRFRVAPDAEASFVERAEAAVAFFRFRPGNVTADLVRNLNEPDLWAIRTEWENVGSYRRALGSYEGKMHIQPLMVHALDEPSAYEVVEEGTDLNEAQPRSLG